MWNLGFSEVVPDSASVTKLNNNLLYLRKNDQLRPFSRIATAPQMIPLQEVEEAIESDEFDKVSTDRKQQVRGLMFASLDGPSPFAPDHSLFLTTRLEFDRAAFRFTRFVCARSVAS
jgi:hypothetical protein